MPEILKLRCLEDNERFILKKGNLHTAFPADITLIDDEKFVFVQNAVGRMVNVNMKRFEEVK